MENLLKLAKVPSTAGLVMSLPYSIMKHLDELDEPAIIIGACNNIYYKQDDLPNFEPKTETEVEVATMLESFLS
ncbi:hypothetical protein PENANT_c027G11773 [Penicillium antarcticum]|uniref:Uncharacterized protein n=1 Tax=Penicillium antarcticum TaxID=416450 RepID=A0A1V6PX19_9EURO|nr:hypothetical protein PENANT_c027G11773 [Penicillium antarcticum]